VPFTKKPGHDIFPRAIPPLIRHPEDTAVDEGSPYHQVARVVITLISSGDPERGYSKDVAILRAQGDEVVVEERRGVT